MADPLADLVAEIQSLAFRLRMDAIRTHEQIDEAARAIRAAGVTPPDDTLRQAATNIQKVIDSLPIGNSCMSNWWARLDDANEALRAALTPTPRPEAER